MIKRKILVWTYRRSEEFLRGKERLKEFRPIRAYRRRLNYYVISHYKSDYVEIDGRKMFLDSNDSLRLSLMNYGSFYRSFVKSQIKKGDLVLDLGAHIGFWTLFMAQLIGDQGKVFAFEPDPSNFNLLRKNVAVNRYRNVTLVQKAVSNKTGKTRLYLASSIDAADHRIYDPHENRKFIDIESIRIDDYFKNYDDKIDFIKSNIQGSDFAAMEGMFDVLKKSRNLKMMVEFSPYLLLEFGTKPEEVLRTLREEGFNLYDLNERKKKIIPMQINELLEAYPPAKRDGTYLYCTREKLV